MRIVYRRKWYKHGQVRTRFMEMHLKFWSIRLIILITVQLLMMLKFWKNMYRVREDALFPNLMGKLLGPLKYKNCSGFSEFFPFIFFHLHVKFRALSANEVSDIYSNS